MTKLTNCTPHDIVIDTDTTLVTIPPSGRVARVAMTTSKVASVAIDGDDGSRADVPIMVSVAGDVYDVPDPTPDTYYIVSRLVLDSLPDRDDLVVPTGMVRDDAGNILGCTGLSR